MTMLSVVKVGESFSAQITLNWFWQMWIYIYTVPGLAADTSLKATAQDTLRGMNMMHKSHMMGHEPQIRGKGENKV